MQQINLFLNEFQPKRDWVSARYCLGIVMCCVMTFVGLAYLDHAKLEKARSTLAVKQEDAKALRAAVALTKKMSNAGDKSLVEAQLRQVKQAIANREHVRSIIQYQKVGNDTGFSSYLEGLAEHSVSGVSLEHFTFSRGGKTLEFSGVGREADLVPHYIDMLSQDARFAETQFGQLSISRPVSGGRLRFSAGYQEGSTSQSSSRVKAGTRASTQSQRQVYAR